MQRIRHVRFVHEQDLSTLSPYSEFSTEYSSLQPATHSSSNPIATALVSAGALIITIWSASYLSNRETYAAPQTPPAIATTALPASHAPEQSPNVPAYASQVRAGIMGLYHWKADCPLDGAPSLRHDASRVQRKPHIVIKRDEAEIRGFRACAYCMEIEYWRGRQAGTDAAPASLRPTIN